MQVLEAVKVTGKLKTLACETVLKVLRVSDLELVDSVSTIYTFLEETRKRIIVF